MVAIRSLLLMTNVAAFAIFSGGDNLKLCLQYVFTYSGSVAFPGDPFYQLVDVNRYNINVPVTPAAVTFYAVATGSRSCEMCRR